MKRFCFLSIVAIAIAGCGKAKPVAVAPKPATQKVVVETGSVDPVPENATKMEEILVEEVVIVDRTPAEENKVDTSVPDEKAVPRTARVMLLSDEGPMLVDLHVTRAGESALAKFDRTVEMIMDTVRGDAEGPLTWKTMLDHPRVQSGDFGNPQVGNYDAQTNTIRQYDTTKNGRVDRNELVRFLTNNQSSQAISLLTSNDRRNESRDASPIRLLLDQDGNRQLDAEELASASQRLRTRDADDDDILSPNELVDSIAGSDPMMSRTRRRYQNLDPKSGWLLDMNGREVWSNVRIAWETLYAGGQSLMPTDIGERLFVELDLDQDGRVDNTEMEMLIEIEPDLALHIELANQPPEISLLASRIPKESIHALLQHHSNRITIRLPNSTLDLFANKTDSNVSRNQSAALFQSADANEDGSLSRAEFEEAESPNNLSFDSVDLDRDGMVTIAEIEDTLLQRTAVIDSQLRIRADHQNDALFCVVDLNADGRLDGREIEAATESLKTLDRNGDAMLHSREINSAMMLGVVLGGSANGANPNQREALLEIPTVRRQTSESVPDWFAGMDRNEDQSISWREFLGTREQFTDLDSDSDGFVDAVEAMATSG